MTNFNINRRSAIQGLLAISTAGALAACSNSEADKSASKILGDSELASFKGFFSTEEMALLTAIADTIIPTTDTPGAVAAGVPNTLQALATEWADDSHRAYWRGGLRTFDMNFPDFAGKDTGTRETLLGEYDAKVFAGEVEDKFYRDLKSTIATAYYMSEPGATQELAYEAVPGEWKGCVPLTDYPKTWAT